MCRMCWGLTPEDPKTPYIELSLDEDEAQCDAAAFRAGSHVELEALADSGRIPAHLDVRSRRRESTLEIAAAAERVGAGRIVGRRD